MEISLVVAMDEDRLIGAHNALPWRLPADLKHFKRTTMGHPMVMGRCTWDSIGKALPGRLNIVVTSKPGYGAEGAVVVDSIEAAKGAAGDCDELMVIGGARIFEQVLPDADRIYLTEIHARFEGDTWFPQISEDQWICVSREDFHKDDKNPWDYSFMVLERMTAALPPTLIQPAL
jgi:dihydrofolate reductase